MSDVSMMLKRGREKWILEGHPWIFRAAVAKEPKGQPIGEVVDVVDWRGKFIAKGFYNSHSSIPLRVLSRDPDEIIDAQWMSKRIHQAVVLRARAFDDEVTSAYRLVHGENDFLPGLVVDKYGEFLVVQIHTLGMDRWRDVIAEALMLHVSPKGIYERSDVGARQGEGLETLPVGLLAGEEPPEQVDFLENGMKFVCDVRTGQKTGFFLDQRDNRVNVAAFCQDAEVLNCFSYSGGFSVFAAQGGATRVESVDASEPALLLAKENLSVNGFDSKDHPCIQENVFDYLKVCKEKSRQFDVIVVDPPAFAKSSGALKRASRAYVRLNRMAIDVLKPGGILVSASCSSAVDDDTFLSYLRTAGAETRRDIQVIKTHFTSIDHPGFVAFPEGRYLKCFFCVVT
ncbi:MAG: class I SAM-dependent rRNA methyltransferase [Candidatus Latescibacteria bacterium]|nr:class I SAM-dependent rRNA methyltransferase [Candidatus Latescibacterota bacterium]